MSWVTVIWSMTASACLTLAAIYLVVRLPCHDTGVRPIPSKAAGFFRATRRVGGIWLVAATFCLLGFETCGANPTSRSSPDYLIDTWETEDGLPENSATAMVQTPEGYLWFGTFNGLVRFDGVKFTVFNPGNTPELPSASIVNLHLDKSAQLWVSTERGLVVRDGKTAGGKWRTFGPKEGWAGNYVRMFAERGNGDLLMTTFDGHVLEFVNDRFTELPQPPGEAGAGYLCWADESGQWWVVQNRFIGRWDGARWVPTLSSPEVPMKAGVCLGCAPARDGGLWLLLNTELRKYSHGKEVSRRQVPNDAAGMLGSVSGMSEDSLGNVWISTYEAGLTQVLPTGGVGRWYEPNGMSYTDVRFVFEDRESNLWVGTSGGGLMRFKPRRFQSFGETSQPPLRVVNSVWPAPDGGLWVATFGRGLFRIGEKGNIERWPDDGPQNNRFYQSVLSDRVGRTWVGKLEEGLYVFEDKVGRQVPEQQTGGKKVIALFEDSQGRVWISGGRGISVFSAGVFRVFGPEQGLPAGAVCGFAEDREGRIWASNLNGVFRLENERFIEVRGGGRESIREIACLKSDGDGTMWMGSLSAGLLRWREGSLATIGVEVGLLVRSVYGILEDNQGYFWMASDHGVVRVQSKDLRSVADGATSVLSGQLCDLSDGLPSVELPGQRQPTCARDASGRLWFATLKGVAMIDPARFRPNTLPPPVQIEEIVYRLGARGRGEGAQTERRLSAPFPEALELPPNSVRIEIHFTALSFVAPEKVRFETQLEGEDSQWHVANNRRVAEFHELRPGHYVFRVRAANNDGVWNQAGASLAFAMRPFLWQTWWFRAVGLAALAGFSGVIGWRRNHLKHRRQLMELEITLRHQAELARVARVSMLGQLASSLAHELNQPLGAILRNAEAAELFLREPAPDLEEVRAILADICKDDQRAGEVIDRLRALIKRREVERRLLDLNLLAGEVVALVRTDAEARRVRLLLETGPALPPVLGDRVQLQQVVLNLVLNAMDAVNDNAPGKRLVTLRARPAGDTVEVSITDDGHGIPADRLGRVFEPFFTTKPNGLGMGLAISRSIVEAHGGRLWAENNPAGGATFTLSLPAAIGGEAK